MFFKHKIIFDWNPISKKIKTSRAAVSHHTTKIFETPFGIWKGTIDCDGYLISLIPNTQHPSDFNLKETLSPSSIPTKARVFGTPFQISVWHALTTIPFGTTSNYSAIAAMIDNPLARRAVGTAIGNNPIIGLIPCHRILAKDGTLGGFSYGSALKQQLLRYEEKISTAEREKTSIDVEKTNAH
jgi:O-6-methylguanine DNA methyltransferase